MSRAALVYSGQDSDGSLLADLQAFMNGDGGWRQHNGLEGCSSIYESWNVASVLAVLHWARNVNNDPLTTAHAQRWLRTEWTKLALSAIRAPTDVEYYSQGSWLPRRPRAGSSDYISGLWSACPGNRMTGLGLNYVDQSKLGPLLSWAVNDPQRNHRASSIVADPTYWSWVLWLMQHLYGSPYSVDLPASAWGLSNTEQDNLRSFALNPSLAGVRRILGYLHPFVPHSNHGFVFRHFTGRGLLTCLQRSVNSVGDKPGVPVFLGNRANMKIISPSDFNFMGGSAASSTCQIQWPNVGVWARSQEPDEDNNEVFVDLDSDPLFQRHKIKFTVIWYNFGLWLCKADGSCESH
ncbi:MAG: hypothetical protein AAF657_12495 [Acidobacteriota bacterium]